MLKVMLKRSNCQSIFVIIMKEEIRVLCQFSIMLPEIQLVGYEE